MNKKGFIEVDHQRRTNVPGIWAIGDVIPGMIAVMMNGMMMMMMMIMMMMMMMI